MHTTLKSDYSFISESIQTLFYSIPSCYNGFHYTEVIFNSPDIFFVVVHLLSQAHSTFPWCLPCTHVWSQISLSWPPHAPGAWVCVSLQEWWCAQRGTCGDGVWCTPPEQGPPDVGSCRVHACCPAQKQQQKKGKVERELTWPSSYQSRQHTKCYIRNWTM